MNQGKGGSDDDIPLIQRLKKFLKKNKKTISLEAVGIVVLIILLLILVFSPKVAHAETETGNLKFELKQSPLALQETPFPVGVYPPPPEPVVESGPTPSVQPQIQQVPVYSGSVWELGKQMCVARFGEAEWEYFNDLVDRESGWNSQATNSSSGAFGLGQALPASKMSPYGDINNPEVQLRWMLDYVSERYSLPSGAIQFHNRNNFY